MGWGAFQILELLSSQRYSQKRLAYLVGSLLLPRVPEMTMMATCQLKKDFQSKNVFEICSAVSFSAAVCTKEISFCIEDDLQRLMTYSKASVKKRACLLCRKLILTNGELGDRISKLLLEKLKDEDVGVQIAATAAILDCAIVYPAYFVEGIPLLYKLLESKNNWLVIKALQAVSKRSRDSCARC